MLTLIDHSRPGDSSPRAPRGWSPVGEAGAGDELSGPCLVGVRAGAELCSGGKRAWLGQGGRQGKGWAWRVSSGPTLAAGWRMAGGGRQQVGHLLPQVARWGEVRGVGRRLYRGAAFCSKAEGAAVGGGR